ncbi:hypothetical protein BJ742DRAFT_461248 [Cladochytrium replicatum]|nr:hypothetical protein BJ742DRAFT_461248 [Cladochytrium replicatum]
MDGSSIAAEAGSVNYTFLENFVESIAQLISQGLTDRETERLLTSFSAFNERLRQLSYQNLTRLAKEAPYKRPYCKHHGTCTNNALRGFVRSFAVTYAIKPGTLLKIGGRDTVSFALFLSTLISAYKGTLCACRRMFPKPDHQKMNAFIAGTVCGLSLLLDKNKSRRIMIALYLSTRTMHFMSRWVWRHYIEHLFESKEESVSSNGGTPHVSSDSLDRASSEENEDADDGIQMHKAAHVSAPPSVVEKLAANGNGPKPLTPISILKPAPKMKVSSSTDHGKSRASQVRKMMRSISGTIVMMLSSAQVGVSFLERSN